MIVRAAQANALVAVEPGDGELAAGEAVRFLRALVDGAQATLVLDGRLPAPT